MTFGHSVRGTLVAQQFISRWLRARVLARRGFYAPVPLAAIFSPYSSLEQFVTSIRRSIFQSNDYMQIVLATPTIPAGTHHLCIYLSMTPISIPPQGPIRFCIYLFTVAAIYDFNIQDFYLNQLLLQIHRLSLPLLCQVFHSPDRFVQVPPCIRWSTPQVCSVKFLSGCSLTSDIPIRKQVRLGFSWYQIL